MTIHFRGQQMDLIALVALIISVVALVRSFSRDRIAISVRTMWADRLSAPPDEEPVPGLVVNVANTGHRSTSIQTITLSAWDARHPFRRRHFYPVPVRATDSLPYPLAPGATYASMYDKSAIDQAMEGLRFLRVHVHVVGAHRKQRVGRKLTDV
jgi:hypothetical protein